MLDGEWARQNPEQVEAIIPIVFAIVGAIGAFFPDKEKTNKEIIVNDSYPIEHPIEIQNETKEEKDKSITINVGWGDK